MVARLELGRTFPVVRLPHRALLQQSTPEARGLSLHSADVTCDTAVNSDMLALSVRSIPPYWPEEAHTDRFMFIDECYLFKTPSTVLDPSVM